MMLIIGLCVFCTSYLYYPSQSFSPNHCCRQDNEIGRFVCFCSLICTYPSQSSPNPGCRNSDDNINNRFVCLCSLTSTNPSLLISAAEILMMMLIIGLCVFVYSYLYYLSQSFSPNHCCRQDNEIGRFVCFCSPICTYNPPNPNFPAAAINKCIPFPSER